MTSNAELKRLFGSGKELTAANFSKLIDAFGQFLVSEVGLELPKDLTLKSTDAGGLNKSDSTSRLNLESYQKAQLNNDGKTEKAHYGELIRLDAKHQQAKAVIAFREGYTDEGKDEPRTVAWLVAHGEANDSTAENPVWHNHLSFEICDLNGMIQTIAEMPFAPSDVPHAYGLDPDDFQFRTTNKLVAGNQGLYVEGKPGADRSIKFSSGKYAKNGDRRWSVGADTTAETGSQKGSDFRISRYKDDGSFWDTPFFVNRSGGRVGIQCTDPTRVLDINGDTMRLRKPNTPSSATATGKAGCIRWDQDYLYVCVATNKWKRAKLETW